MLTPTSSVPTALQSTQQCGQWFQETFGQDDNQDASDIHIRLAAHIRATGDAFFTQQKDMAQLFLDALQRVSDQPDLPNDIRRLLIATLVRLARGTGLYPSSLILRGVEIQSDFPVACGAYGEVYEGILRGKQVAVKVMRVNQKDFHKLVKRFSQEIALWRQCHHPNILPFYGVFWKDVNERQACLVSPWMENGTLVYFLKQNPEADRVLLALDISRGLEFLHYMDPRVIHGDIKGTNILVTTSGHACLADFGFSKAQESDAFEFSNPSNAQSSGTVRWQAPELFDSTNDLFESEKDPYPNTYSTDIYAFGCVCYEIFSGYIPFHEVERNYVVMGRVLQGARPARPENPSLTDQMWSLVEQCWDQNQQKRPSARTLVDRIASFRQGKVDSRPRLDWTDSGSLGLLSERSIRSNQVLMSAPGVTRLAIEDAIDNRFMSKHHHSNSETWSLVGDELRSPSPAIQIIVTAPTRNNTLMEPGQAT